MIWPLLYHPFPIIPPLSSFPIWKSNANSIQKKRRHQPDGEVKAGIQKDWCLISLVLFLLLYNNSRSTEIHLRWKHLGENKTLSCGQNCGMETRISHLSSQNVVLGRPEVEGSSQHCDSVAIDWFMRAQDTWTVYTNISSSVTFLLVSLVQEFSWC